MARRVAVLGAEGGSEGVDVSQRQGTELALQLAGNGEADVLAEEVFGVIHLAFGRFRQVVGIEGRYREHLTGTLRIGCGDERGVEVEEPSVVEVLVNGVGHGVAQTEHASKVVGSRTEMPDFTEKFHAVSLLLQRVTFGIGGAVNLDFFGLDFHHLALALRFHQRSHHAQA